MTDDRKTVLDWLVAQPDTAWFDTQDVAKGSGVDQANVLGLLSDLGWSGDVESYEGGSGPLMYYASAKARREAVQDG